MPSPHQLRRVLADWSPYGLADTAARYSLAGSASDSSYIIDGLNRLQLIADRSGNSANPILALPGVNGNYVSFTALTPIGTGDFSFSVKVRIVSLAADRALFGGANNAPSFRITSGGAVQIGKISVGVLTASTTTVSAFQLATIGYTRSGTTGTYYVDGVAAGTVTDNNDYTVGISEIGSLNGGTAIPALGNIHWCRTYSTALTANQMLADSQGTVQSGIVINADFTTLAKLATSGSATTGQSFTINTSGDIGARICGARDVVQLTQSKQPIFSTGSDGVNVATFDGSNDYMGGALYSLGLSSSTYISITQKGTTAGSILTILTLPSQCGIYQRNNVLDQWVIYDGSDRYSTVAMTTDIRQLLTATRGTNLNTFKTNNATPVTINAAASASSYLSYVGWDGSASRYGNFSLSDILIKSVTDPNDIQLRIGQYFIKKDKI